MTELPVRVQPRKVSLWLGSIVIILAALHLIAHAFINPAANDIATLIGVRFDMDQEVSIPTWYNQMILAVASIILFIIGYAKRQKLEKYFRHWIGLGWIFMYLSLDEGSSIHEMMGPILANALKGEVTFTSYFYFAWVIAGLIFFALVSLVYFRFWLALPRKTKWLFLAAAVIFLSGAVGMEMIGAHYITSGHDYDYIYAIFSCLEELGEQLGVVLFIYTLLAYAAKQSISVAIEPATGSRTKKL